MLTFDAGPAVAAKGDMTVANDHAVWYYVKAGAPQVLAHAKVIGEGESDSAGITVDAATDAEGNARSSARF